MPLIWSYGLKGAVLDWFESYLRGRVQQVRSTMSSSTPSPLLYGVPQGSVLGPILFLLYTADLLQLIKRHHLIPHGYADDTQLCGFCQPSLADDLAKSMSVCVDDVSRWNEMMTLDQLQKISCVQKKQDWSKEP